MLIYSKYTPSSKYFKKSFKGAFTLVELLVVMAIATILMTTLIINQNSWNDQLALSTQTYEMALTIRQAQIYSLGVREYTAGSGDKFNIGYGVYLSDVLGQYIFFADANANRKYDIGEGITTKVLGMRVGLDRFCGSNGGGQEICYPNPNVSKLNILFLRPELKANIVFINNVGDPSVNLNPPAKIYLHSQLGRMSIITIEANGQISIK